MITKISSDGKNLPIIKEIERETKLNLDIEQDGAKRMRNPFGSQTINYRIVQT